MTGFCNCDYICNHRTHDRLRWGRLSETRPKCIIIVVDIVAVREDCPIPRPNVVAYMTPLLRRRHRRRRHRRHCRRHPRHKSRYKMAVGYIKEGYLGCPPSQSLVDD